MGSCFHQALHRWALLHANGEHGFRIALGVVRPNLYDLKRHLHAWIERDGIVISAVTGESFEALTFYRTVGIEAFSIARVNPRSILRSARWVIDRDTVTALLNASGISWQVVNGGVLPK